MGRTHGIQLETRIWWRRFQETDQEVNRRSRQKNHDHARSRPARDPGARFLAKSERHNASGLPNRGLSKMPLDPQLNGRMERRLPIIVAVRLAPYASAGVDGEERTYTDNISERGARIFSKHAWQPGDPLWITLSNGHSACGQVVYCQRLPDGRYTIGVNFQDQPVTWLSVRKYYED